MYSDEEIDNIINDIDEKLDYFKNNKSDLTDKHNNFLEEGIKEYNNKNYLTALLNLSIGLNNKNEKKKYSELIKDIVNKLEVKKTSENNQRGGTKKEESIKNQDSVNKLKLSTLQDIENFKNIIKNNTSDNIQNLNFNSIPGYISEKKELYQKFLHPNIFNELYHASKYNLLLYGPYGNNKKILARMCIGELKKLSDDLDIVYIEFDLHKMLSFKNDEINIIFNNLQDRIKKSKSDSKISRCIIYLENLNYLYNNTDLTELLEKIFYKLDEFGNNEDIMLIGSTSTITQLPIRISNNFQNKLFIDLPDFYERVFYLFEFIISRYRNNFPNKLLNIYFKVDMNINDDFCKNFIKYKEIFYKKEGVNLLELYPILEDIIEINNKGEKNKKKEKICDYKNRLKNQIYFFNFIDSNYFTYICNEINKIDEINYSQGIIINFNYYMIEFSKLNSKKIIEFSEISEKNNIPKILKYIETNLFDFYIFLHYISDLIGPNLEIYKLSLISNKRFSEHTVSSYGYSVNDIENYIKNMTVHMADNIINSKYNKIINDNVFSNPISFKNNQDNDPYMKIAISNRMNNNQNMFTVLDKNDNFFDILAFFKMTYFYDAFKKNITEMGNNDDYCMFLHENKILSNEKYTLHNSLSNKFIL